MSETSNPQIPGARPPSSEPAVDPTSPAGSNLPRRLTVDDQPSLETDYAGDRHRDSDETCGFVIESDFQRFNGANDTFARAQWDQRVRSDKAIQWFKSMFTNGLGVRDVEGYRAKDFAIRNAAWVGANLLIERNLANERHDGFLDDLGAYAPVAKDKIEITDETNRQPSSSRSPGCSAQI